MRLHQTMRLRANGETLREQVGQPRARLLTLALALMLTLLLLLTASAGASPSIAAISGTTDFSASDTFFVSLATPQGESVCDRLKRELKDAENNLAQHQKRLAKVESELQDTRSEISDNTQLILFFASIQPTNHDEAVSLTEVLGFLRHRAVVLLAKEADLEVDERVQKDVIMNIEARIVDLKTGISTSCP